MNEEKINQILRNQNFLVMMSSPTEELFIQVRAELLEMNNKLLNPTKQPSIAELTEDAFSKDGEE